jgi:FAD-dependent urate hydroxylase
MVTADLTVLARRTGFPVTSVPRDRLIGHLAQGVPVEFSREIVDVEVRPDGVTAVDAAGHRHEADVVVGADGHRSAVRRAVLDPAPATENTWTTWQGLSPVLPELAAGVTGVCVVGHAGLVGLLPSGDLPGYPSAICRLPFGRSAGLPFGMIPPSLVGRAYVAQLRSVSSVLHDETGFGGAPGR